VDPSQEAAVPEVAPPPAPRAQDAQGVGMIAYTKVTAIHLQLEKLTNLGLK